MCDLGKLVTSLGLSRISVSFLKFENGNSLAGSGYIDRHTELKAVLGRQMMPKDVNFKKGGNMGKCRAEQ